MKRAFLLFAVVTAALAQSDPTTTATAIDLASASSAISKAQSDNAAADAKIASLTKQLADALAKLAAVPPADPLITKLDTQCPTCRDALNTALSGATEPLVGIVLCCGPATVPATKPGTSILYLVPVSQTVTK